MKPRQFEVNDDDEKSTRRERFQRRKASGEGGIDASRRPKGERYRRPHVNFDNMTDDDLDGLLDEED